MKRDSDEEGKLIATLDDFYKAKSVGISDTQLYRQAGNSIVVNVLEAIFQKLLKQ